MNRIVYRSTSFVFAAVMTLGTLKGIALLASSAVIEALPLLLPVVEVVAVQPAPVQLAADDR